MLLFLLLSLSAFFLLLEPELLLLFELLPKFLVVVTGSHSNHWFLRRPWQYIFGVGEVTHYLLFEGNLVIPHTLLPLLLVLYLLQELFAVLIIPPQQLRLVVRVVDYGFGTCLSLLVLLLSALLLLLYLLTQSLVEFLFALLVVPLNLLVLQFGEPEAILDLLLSVLLVLSLLLFGSALLG